MSESSAPRPSRRRKRHWLKTAVLALVIFLCGAVAGGGVTSHMIWSRMRDAFKDPSAIPTRIAGHMQRKLDLTDDQRDEIEAIFRSTGEELMALREEVEPRLADHFRKARDEVKAVLTPEQAEKWEKEFGERRKHWFPHLPIGPPSFGPPGFGGPDASAE
ncbi:MAG: hypothetical protein GY851_25985 [bacterium]|nr:hypothetical protein [bacterium]